MIGVFDIRNFLSLGKTGSGRFTHKIERGKFLSSEKVFVRKEMTSPRVARQEVLAQELFRLLLPTQPETRLAWHPINGTYYVLSEEIPNYRLLPMTPHEFTNGQYTGLGQILLGALFLQEIDLKNGNVGISGNQVIKIDGDWSFAFIRDPSFFTYQPEQTITTSMIETLPYPKFYAFNWLDLIFENVAQSRSRIVDPAALCNASSFRREVNQAILKILLLPESYLERLVDAFIPAGGSRYLDFLKQRRNELKQSALQSLSFKAYLSSPQAANDAQMHWNYIKAFKVQGDYPILSEQDHECFKAQFDSSFRMLQESSSMSRSSRINSNVESRLEVEHVREDQQIEIDHFSSVAKFPRIPVWKSFLSGFFIGGALILSFILLRVIDVMTFGLSLPLTVTISAAMVLSAGLLMGAITKALWPQVDGNKAEPKKTNKNQNQIPSFVDSAKERIGSFKELTHSAETLLNSGKINTQQSQPALKQGNFDDNPSFGP
ncbi:hypothetical protein [Legionella impletisoli]|uniref:Uncharacterized protein n=1 Tax=Legionella impletisoli TaxID=343510 RepID=A0A917JMB1_9GAMM|nr:hypothetical protein [Legionella impletisoli]GGI77301.1 hypothetical protein GCM10007966_02510 [Legionella impletisoli]